MKHKQGGTRSLPEGILIEQAVAREEHAARAGNEFLLLHRFKHGQWRFDERFLKDAFRLPYTMQPR